MRIIGSILGRLFGKDEELPCGCPPGTHGRAEEAEMGARALFYRVFQDEVAERLRAKIKLKYNHDIDRIAASIMVKHADIKFYVDDEERARARAAAE